MTDPLQGLARNYRVAFLRYLPRREEEPLHQGYELGREAFARGISMLELARVHHEVRAGVLLDCDPTDLTPINTAASEFLLEALSTYDMTQRRLLE